MSIHTTFKHNEHSQIVLKLIYFWAYVEAGLAGLLHILHIPITGLVAGGFSIIINVLIAHYSDTKIANLLKALGIVLAVKFVLSPFTPVGAYVAVCFQGLLAVLLFGILPMRKISILVFAIVCMLESALQKPLLAILLFKKQFWISILIMVKATFKVSPEEATEKIYWMFAIYLFVYICWAILMAKWAHQLRYKLAHIQLSPAQQSIVESFSFTERIESKSFRKIKVPVFVALAIAFILLIFPFVVHHITWLYVLRICIIIVLVVFIFPYLIRKHQSFLFSKNKEIVSDIAQILPQLKSRTAAAWELAKDKKWHQRLYHFVWYSIWLNVFYEAS